MDVTSKTAIALVGGQCLVVEKQIASNVLKLIAADGQLCLSIRITPDGPVLMFEGGNLAIESSGVLALTADRIAIHAREGLSLTTDGDMDFKSGGDSHSEARTQNVTACLGNVNLKANDDIRLIGERVRVNC